MNFLDALHDYFFPGLEAILDFPHWAETITEFYGSNARLIVTSDHVTSDLQFGHFETVKPGEILDFSLGKTFLFFCWPRSFVRCSDVQKWSHYMFRAVRLTERICACSRHSFAII